MSVKEVSAPEIENVVNNFEPIGLFYYQESPTLFIAVDNSDGKAWTEEFMSKEDCIKWLVAYQ